MINLATIIGRMNLYTPVNNKPDVLKVNAIDQAIRVLRRKIQPPWNLRRSTMRVFSDVFEYPYASDHARLAFLNDPNLNSSYGEQPRYAFSSLKDFIDNATYGNSLAEIWQGGEKHLGIRSQRGLGAGSMLLSAPTDVSLWATSGDAGTPVLDEVVYEPSDNFSSSIRVPIVLSSGTARIANTFTVVTDPNYMRKYHFRYVYLDGIPDSIELRLGADSSNYRSAVVTTQFSGAPLQADAWNLLAFDMNTSTPTGTPGTSFARQDVLFTNAPTGTYYFDASYLRSWTIQEYWYYSKNNVVTADGLTSKQYFAADGATFDTTDLLIGDDDIWADILAFMASTFLLSDEKEQAIKKDVQKDLDEAMLSLYETYPDLQPQIGTTVFNFITDYQAVMGDSWGYYD